MKEYHVSVCVRINGVERYRLYIEKAANRDEAKTKAIVRAQKESLIPVPNRTWVLK